LRLECQLEAFNAALQSVLGAVPQRPTFAALGCVLLEASLDGQLTLVADNQEVRASASVQAVVSRGGRAAVQANLLSEFTSPLQSSRLRLDEKSQVLRASSAGLDSRMRCQDAAEFPRMLELEPGYWADVRIDTLVQATEQVRTVISRQDSQPVLTGMLIDARQTAITFAATDGHRLAERKLRAESGKGVTRVLVPGRWLHLLPRLVKRGTGVARIQLLGPDRRITFSVPGGELSLQLLEGKFPKYQQFIPPSPPTVVRVPVVQLVSELRAITVFARDEAHRVELTVSDGRLTAQAVTKDVGRGRIDMSAATEGPSATATVNIGYLTHALESVDDLEAELRFTPDGPLTIAPASGETYLHVIMQVRPQR
jgi:DNA polymerase III subunit beta